MFFTTVMFLTLSTLATAQVFEATEAPQLTDAHKRVKCQMSRDYTCEGRYNDFSATKKIVSSREYCVDWCEQQLMFDSSMFMNDQRGCCEFWQEKSMCLYFEYGKALKLNNKGSGKGYSAGNCGKQELPEYCVEEDAGCCIATAEGMLGYGGHCQKCCHGTCGQKWPWEPATCQRNYSELKEEPKSEESEKSEQMEAPKSEESEKTEQMEAETQDDVEEKAEKTEAETEVDTKTETKMEEAKTETAEEAKTETSTSEIEDDTTETVEEAKTETVEEEETEATGEETAASEMEDDNEETVEEEETEAPEEEETAFEMEDDTKTGEEKAGDEETDIEMVPPPQSDLGFFRNLRGLANHMTA